MHVINKHRSNRGQHTTIVVSKPGSPAITSATVSRYFAWKRVFDRIAAILLLIPGLPVIAILTLLVRLTSRGPGIFCQKRVGQDGCPFLMYKIRTMRQDAEAATGPVWTQQSDPRITLVGRILRKLHLDEFPQLFNVLKGEMSLIGPRPERPEFVAVLAEQIPGYLQRLAVPPGITGLSQINLPPDTDLDSVRRKLVLDLEYIEQAGPLLDFRMLCCTLTRLLGLPGEQVMTLFGLRRHVTLPANDRRTARRYESVDEPVKSISVARRQDGLDRRYGESGGVAPLAATPHPAAGPHGRRNPK